MGQIDRIKVIKLLLNILRIQNTTFYNINLWFLVLFSSMTLILDFTSLVEEKTKDVKKNDETAGCIYSELRVPKYQRNHSYSGYTN